MGIVANFYTSPILPDLFTRSTHTSGTLVGNRRGVPLEVKCFYEKLKSDSTPRGTGSYVRVGSIVYSVWRDTKCLSVLSTKHPGHSENKVQRNMRDSEGKHKKMDVLIPEAVYQYNRYMGGVDWSDQLIKYYNVLRQTKKYWKTLFFTSSMWL